MSAIRFTGWQVAVVAYVFTLLVGCNSVKEVHYFAAANFDAEQPELTFYRISINARSNNAKTTYQAGFHDAKSLHNLFGQVKSKDDESEVKESQRVSGSYRLRIDPVSGRTEVIDNDDRFTVMYGADTDAMSQQLQLFADSEIAGKEIARLMAGAATNAFVGVSEAQSNAGAEQARAKKLAGKVETVNAALKEDTSAKDLRILLLQIVQEASDLARSDARYDPADLSKAFEDAAKVHERLKSSQ